MPTWWSSEGTAPGDEDLPAYLDGPGEDVVAARPSLELARAGARRVASAFADAHNAIVAVPPPSALSSPIFRPGEWLSSPRPALGRSGVFIRMVDLPGRRLGAMLDEWWAATAVGGLSAVGRRLRLGPPAADGHGGWTIPGRVRRLAPWRWAPVVVELWPRYERWTMLTMTPQAGVLTTRRYFRSGHAAIDRLTRILATTQAATA